MLTIRRKPDLTLPGTVRREFYPKSASDTDYRHGQIITGDGGAGATTAAGPPITITTTTTTTTTLSPLSPVMAGWRRLRGRTGEVYDKPKALARGGAEQSVLCSQMLFSDSASYLHQQPHATSYITVELHSHHQIHAGT